MCVYQVVMKNYTGKIWNLDFIYNIQETTENTEKSLSNDVRHRKFLVEPMKIIIINNQLNSKCQK